MSKKNLKKEGIISVSSKGIGFVDTEELGKEVEIPHQSLNASLHGDRVLVDHIYEKQGKKYGKIIKVIERAKENFAGVVMQISEKGIEVEPDDIRFYENIYIPKKDTKGAKVGQKVFVNMLPWENQNTKPEGRVLFVLGNAGENDAEMKSIIMEKGLEIDLPQKTKEEAEAIKRKGITEEDYKGRKDMRSTITFTIDPDDAKDFDDALSIKEVNKNKYLPQGGYEIGVHIADVTHYVKEGSDLDKEAKKRATSIYLVDRTVPMLPEVLSNDLCSLMEGEERLTVSTIFQIDKNAKIKHTWFGRTIINSDKRFTYELAETTIKNNNLPYNKELLVLNKLAKKLEKERFKKGAVRIESEEVKFVLDEEGKPLKVIPKERGDSNKLIEEFMLLANKKVAEYMAKKTKKEGVFIYRVHDAPNPEKMEDLYIFLRSTGHKPKLKNGIIENKEINRILKRIKGHPEEGAVQRVVTRSMSKAVYSTENIGHYGLAFKHYTHFTSPIRRYPDIIAHRLLLKETEQHKKETKQKIYQQIAENSSRQEKKATEAQRASIKYKQVEYMSERISMEFNGVISGISRWGIFVQEKKTKCEGMVKLKDLKDFYIFDEKKMELVGKRKKNKYKLGQLVKIRVKKADLERKVIDYELI